MLTRLMRRLGWVRRAEHQKLLVQYVKVLDDHEQMIHLAQALLRQTGGAEPLAGEPSRDGRNPAAKPAKLH